MADQTERLSTSAQKGKRNLLFLGVLAWALALGWIRLASSETRVGLFGVEATASIRVVIVGLGALILYNLVSFWLHGPFGDWRTRERHASLMSPTFAEKAEVEHAAGHIRKVAGEKAFPVGVADGNHLSEWMRSKLGLNWFGANSETKWEGFEFLWNSLPRRTRWKLQRYALTRRHLRLLVFEDLWDLWFPLGVGVSSLGAVVFAGIRYWC